MPVAPCAPSDDALASAFARLADATSTPRRAGAREEERVGRYLRDAAGGGRDAASVGTVRFCRNRRRGAGPRAARAARRGPRESIRR